jgi:hypothetical protein
MDTSCVVSRITIVPFRTKGAWESGGAGDGVGVAVAVAGVTLSTDGSENCLGSLTVQVSLKTDRDGLGVRVLSIESLGFQVSLERGVRENVS